ncbi:hypothetical protein Q5P01_009538 [Channa striata]|uniref:KASH domain-containing protein n=1 Tax=Channa striata TaxID=64152 RepID=A0AA88MWH0_CHASR|nr:hypothetical protein Q5P01_009538 [Channa striata]
MPGGKPAPSQHHGNVTPHTEGSDVAPAEDAMDMKLVLDLSASLFSFPESYPETNREEMQQVGSSWSQDGDLYGCGQLEQRWLLWHEFMKEHAHLDAWLQLAEQAVTSFNATCVTHITAKEELQKFETLRCEARSRQIQLDGLTRGNRTLIQLFQGVMQARLLAAARECGQRWDSVNMKLESTIGNLKLFVSEWEEFDSELEELVLCLADLDVRLTEVDNLNGSTCEKLRRVQSLQQCVSVNSSRVNALLQRGEELIQHREPSDVKNVETRLMEVLRRCNHIYSNIARTHTRLVSMRLVFEDDWQQAADSGCPSGSLLEEGGALSKSKLELPAAAEGPKDPPSPVHPPAPPAPSSPTHDHQGLEWDPSVDIGRSVSCDDVDSSYFSASTGVCHRDGLKRQSYLSSLGSQSDFGNDTVNPDADLQPEGFLDHAYSGVCSPLAPAQSGDLVPGNEWKTSTPEGQDSDVVGFDSGRVRAWLGVQTSCSKEVQTDMECRLDGSQRQRDDDTHQPFPDPSDLKASECTSQTCPSDPQAEEEPSPAGEDSEHLSEQSVTSSSSSRASSSSSLPPPLLYLLLAVALALLACLIWVALEPPCHRGSRMHRSFHLALRYINGPPPT